MLTVQDMMCTQCGNVEPLLSLQVDRGGRLVRFRVDCHKCGGFSHYLEYSEINRAVKEFLDGVALECDKAAMRGEFTAALVKKLLQGRQ